jgi:hypothetical protein
MEIPIRSADAESSGDADDREAEHLGPPLLALAIVVTVLFLGSLVTTALMTHGGHLPSPFEPARMTAGFFAEQAAAVRLSAFLQLGAAIVLGNFAATGASRLRFLGVRVAGVQIALFGGIAAAVLAALSCLLQWVLTQPEITMDPGVIHLVHLALFAFGGIGHVAAAGLLLAGVSLAAGITELLPRWVMWLGLALAVISELATFTLIVHEAAYLLPIARFGTLVWMIAVGACLPKSLAEAERTRRAHQQQPMVARAHSS